ncbi:MAG: 6,7-dimethyl-8-ribityllumazine synthase [Planctomycetota bacterium]|nr:6,7-dimethyl-8-ribityllumazine synthase [Planctomycetota bacterium]MDP6369049.1 6,7-dimethyl-8-ribityllumazine synthase [Planctomycetota bacterium]MDP6518996.1 6,7-dimethyl-8-ribityllumazine synthase [Planctomycetota bacterium]MDP6954634.1 6,7-dimethyl-8-ribityllumazine synthase [Planctomycetota bacterium]
MALDPTGKNRPRPQCPGLRVAAVVSRFHGDLTGAMVESARSELLAGGVAPDDFHTLWVPGAFELPLAAKRLAQNPAVDVVLCFGLVLKGQTRHDIVVADAAAAGIVRASLDTDTPILFGVLTCETLEQARSRALSVDAGGHEDKGREVGRAALEMMEALDEVRSLSARTTTS